MDELRHRRLLRHVSNLTRPKGEEIYYEELLRTAPQFCLMAAGSPVVRFRSVDPHGSTQVTSAR